MKKFVVIALVLVFAYIGLKAHADQQRAAAREPELCEQLGRAMESARESGASADWIQMLQDGMKGCPQ